MNIAITGGCGSLGRGFTAYLTTLGHAITVIDNSEWSTAECRALWPGVSFLLDDYANLQGDFDVVIALAAAKHVDLGETNIEWFIENNVTKLIQLYHNTPSAQHLFIGTDKGVQPISVYGFTKALGERLTWSHGGQVARLGNILNSTGSAIPLWESQIANKEPITITDERCTRYVIEVEDAVHQIWTGYKAGYKLIIPEMGPPQRIMDILSEVLKRHGYNEASEYTPGVVTIGLRPGEKLEEKLRWDYEVK